MRWLAVFILLSGCVGELGPGDPAPKVLVQPAPVQGGGELIANNPIIAGDFPDPTIHREVESDGTVRYYLSATVSLAQDFPLFTSTDLVNWTQSPSGLFGRAEPIDGSSYEINGQHFCSMWGPRLSRAADGTYVLMFTARRFSTEQPRCPDSGSGLDSGIFVATTKSVSVPFAMSDQSEPRPLGPEESCPQEIASSLPQSEPWANMNGCSRGECTATPRLDANIFRDPLDGRMWSPYTWYTNSPPVNRWEWDNHGSHLSIVELEPNKPAYVRCSEETAQVYAVNSRDPQLTQAMAASCDGCGEMLGTTRDGKGNHGYRDGVQWGVAESGSMARAGNLVYLFFSHSYWNSPYYSIGYVAAPTVEELRFDNPSRLVGRLTIPSEGQAFGTGSAILGPDGRNWFYISHHLDSTKCCGRDLWLTPIQAVDRNDGRGAVWLETIKPASIQEVRVPQPR